MGCMTATDCDDGDARTTDVCDPGTGATYTALICDDMMFCNGVETCDSAVGCMAGTPPVIDDGVPCTDDTCDEVNDVAVNTVNDANCDDLVACTDDICDLANDCVFAPVNSNCPTDNVACTDEVCDIRQLSEGARSAASSFRRLSSRTARTAPRKCLL